MSTLAPGMGVAQTPPQLMLQALHAGLSEHELGQLQLALRWVLREFATLMRGSLKPFSAHVIGVASLLLENQVGFTTTMAGLLHASYQSDGSEQRRAHLRQHFGEATEALVFGYQQSAMQEIGSILVPELRLMRLADELEDALDAAPLMHGRPDDSGTEKGSADRRCAQFFALESLFAQTQSTAASFLPRFQALKQQLLSLNFPPSLRTGLYSSLRAQGA
jgi:hypothetical protein